MRVTRSSMETARQFMQHAAKRVQGRPREQRDKPQPHYCDGNGGCNGVDHGTECRRVDGAGRYIEGES